MAVVGMDDIGLYIEKYYSPEKKLVAEIIE